MPKKNTTNTTNTKKKKKKNRRRRRLRIIFTIEFLILLLIVCAGLFVFKLEEIENHKLENVVMNDFKDENMDDYRNIAVFGVDSREGKLVDNCRSDSIIIVSIHKKTHEIKLVSLFRDTIVYLNEEHGYEKATHAYAYGGPDLAVNMLNQNYDLNIQDFVTVNYSAVTNVVDALGGVEIDIKEDELDYVNDYTKDVAKVEGIEYTKIKNAGKQTLTGVQATAYCRVRYTSGGDFTRAERQRTVMLAILEKAKSSNPISLVKLFNEMTSQIYTSLTTKDMLSLGLPIFQYEIKKQEGFPFELEGTTISGMYVNRPLTAYTNTIELHKYLFGTKDFAPSVNCGNYSTTIQNMY